MPPRHPRTNPSSGSSDPLWYKDAIIYELHVRAFCDSDGDGIGDFNGLVSKLDYLQDLGVTALWLLPFYPSPLRDDGYDIADYTDVHPTYGTLADFKRFLSEAHARGLRVITELAINHTSNEHPWFQRARRAPKGSRARDFYVWSDTPDRYADARIIFADFETSNWAWDSVAGQYFWHRFYAHQPDLNFENVEVQRAVLRVLDFWMDLGVDGMRLDAIPYLFERDGTNCENLPETHAFLKRLRAHVDAKYPDRMLLAEANQWPDDAAEYFGTGDECHMNFHFPVMPRLFMSVQLENRFPIVDILRETPHIPESCQWALFLRNHDELTLEMVTDEDRDYMYRTYAEDPRMRVNVGIRRRLAPLLKLRNKIELMSSLLMSLPGTPVMYYGDEFGQGDNVYLGDRNGVRTPMQWSADRNAGFSRANPQRLFLPVIIDPEYHYEAVNVEAQQGNPESLLWWTKRMIAMRRQHPVFGRGSIEFLEPDNAKVLCFTRTLEAEQVLVIANLSRHAQYVELDLSAHRGKTPVEMSGGTHFPTIGERPYVLSLGGYGFIWFVLPPVESPAVPTTPAHMPIVDGKSLDSLLHGRMPKALEAGLRDYLRQRRWFRGKARTIKSVRVLERVVIRSLEPQVELAVLQVDYESVLPERYVIPLGLQRVDAHSELLPEGSIARLRLREPATKAAGKHGEVTDYVLYDATGSDALGPSLLALLGRKRSLTGVGGAVLRSEPGRELRARLAKAGPPLHARLASLEQSNTTFFYGDELILKLFRQLESGENPDAELTRFLSSRGFPYVPPVIGVLELDGAGVHEATLGLVQRFVPNQGNAWDLTIEALRRALEHALSLHHAGEQPASPEGDVLAACAQSPNAAMSSMIGSHVELARLLGRRCADLHAALASEHEDPAFKPEPFAGHHHRSVLESVRDHLEHALELLRKTIGRLPEPSRGYAEEILATSDVIGRKLSLLGRVKVEAQRIRCHGDLHLGQVLYDGRDFMFIDFEGEPAVSLNVRRLKRAALVDVCGMIRSFHYASVVALRSGHFRAEDVAVLRPWADGWYHWVSAAFLDAYRREAGSAAFLPKTEAAWSALLQLHLIDKCAYELGYELNNRPEWVDVPLAGLRSLSA